MTLTTNGSSQLLDMEAGDMTEITNRIIYFFGVCATQALIFCYVCMFAGIVLEEIIERYS